MINLLRRFFHSPSLGSFDATLTRERIVQSGRIVIIDDDERLLLVEDLRKEGFAVDHDATGDDLHNIENQIYDVVILDYHGVGQRLGPLQGLDMLKYIRRVSPRTRVIAFTSRSLNASESEFFRLSHAVLPKDFGLNDSLQLIENELRKAFSKEHLFEALIAKLNVADSIQKTKIEKDLINALDQKNESKFKDSISKVAGSVTAKAVDIIIQKLFQLP